MMKMKRTCLLATVLALALPLAAAAHCGKDHRHPERLVIAMTDHQGHEEMEKMDHGAKHHDGMAMHGDMIMLGDEVQSGVKAMAHLKDVRAAMGKMGMAQTHHFMVMFTNAESGAALADGTVALKITDPSGKSAEPVKLMGMQGHFGADIVLAEQGEYLLEVGTRLADGEKRQFQFKFLFE